MSKQKSITRCCDNCLVNSGNCPALQSSKQNNKKTMERRELTCADHFQPRDMSKSIFN